MEGETGRRRPRGKREQNPFEELKALQSDWSTENRCGGERATRGSDMSEAGSSDGTGAYRMDLSP